MNTILQTVIEIAESLVGEKIDSSNEFSKSSILQIIISESSQAISFVTLIEDEFEIEFNDDEIDMNFFSSFEKISGLVQEHILNNN